MSSWFHPTCGDFTFWAVLSWSYVEKGVEEVIWKFLHLDVSAGRVVTAHLDALHKFRLLRGLADLYMNKEQRASLSILMGRLEDLYELRNIIAHGHWVTIKPDNMPSSMSLRDKLPEGMRRDEVISNHMPSDLMLTTIQNMLLCTNSLALLRDSISPAPHKTSPSIVSG